MPERDDTAQLKAQGSKVTVDERGRSVWNDTIKTANFELVSTGRLRKLLDDDGQQHREEVRKLAEMQTDGYLARDNSTGMFRIIDDDDLQAILDGDGQATPFRRPAEASLKPAFGDAPEEDMSLVSTQALRRILELPEDRDREPVTDEGGGFDPYNKR